MSVQDRLNSARLIGQTIDQRLYITGLHDTPTGYQGHSGDYLVVNDNESGIHFTGIEKIAADLTDYGFGGGGGSINFTGLQDTPNNYSNGSYLKSTTNGLEYAGIEPTKYTSINDLPTQAESRDGAIVRVGCNLYLSCDGIWKKFTQETSEGIDDPNNTFPECVETIEEALQYRSYTEEFMLDYNAENLLRAMDGLPPVEPYNVCLFKKDVYNAVSWVQESWVNRGFANVNLMGVMEKDSNSTIKFKKESDQLFFMSNTILDSNTIDKVDLIVGKINDSFQYETIWTKRVNNEGYNGTVDITDDFNHIIHCKNRENSNSIYDIYVLDHNETTGGYDENRPPITRELAQSLHSSVPLGGSDEFGTLPFRISQDGKRAFVMIGHANSSDTSIRLYIFEWSGTEWTLPYVMNMPQPKDGASQFITAWSQSFLLNQDESIIYLIGGRESTSSLSGGVFEVNYNNASIGPQIGQNFWNHSSHGPVSMNNLGNIITSFKALGQPNLVWKYNENSKLWDNIASVPGGFLSMCRNGKFFFNISGLTGKVYYYNESTNSMVQIAQNLSVVNARYVAGISDSGQSIAYPNNTATIPLSQIPEIEGGIYNNSVSIQESSYKWGLFEENTSINLAGTIDTNCTFTEWQTSDVNLTDPSNINTTANINKSASITGVFNCG